MPLEVTVGVVRSDGCGSCPSSTRTISTSPDVRGPCTADHIVGCEIQERDRVDAWSGDVESDPYTLLLDLSRWWASASSAVRVADPRLIILSGAMPASSVPVRDSIFTRMALLLDQLATVGETGLRHFSEHIIFEIPVGTQHRHGRT